MGGARRHRPPGPAIAARPGLSVVQQLVLENLDVALSHGPQADHFSTKHLPLIPGARPDGKRFSQGDEPRPVRSKNELMIWLNFSCCSAKHRCEASSIISSWEPAMRLCIASTWPGVHSS